MKLSAIYKLLRIKPTVAWSFSGILLGIAVAIHEVGWELHWKLLLYVLLATVIIQSILAHAINDLIDEEVDKRTDMEGTKRAKVLLLGLASRVDLLTMVLFSIAVTLGMAGRIYIELGWIVLVFYAVGLYASLAYSLPPLKLGWRPFSEWTVVFPVLTTLVIATNFVATGKLSWLSFYIGVVFALFNIIWFITSRLMDYEPDMEAGKITSAVYLGLDYKLISVPNTGVLFNYLYQYQAAIGLASFWFSFLAAIFVSPFFVISMIFELFSSSFIIPKYSEVSCPAVLSKYRTYGIIVSTVHSVVLSVLFILA